VLVGSWGGELKNPHLHLYIHIMIPIDCRLFAYLANFMNAGSRIGAIKIWCSMFGVYILDPKLWWIYNSTQYSSNCKPESTYDDLFNRPAFLYLVESSNFHGFMDSQVHKSLKEFFAPLHPCHLLPFPNAH
jgi:hypothetical protein